MADKKRYLLIDETNTIITVFLWDGESPYDPGEGYRTELQTDPYKQSAGAQYVNGEWVLPPLEEVGQHDPAS
jgi:hypothetical protein